jgi:HAD superfamily hydrolase (TIGR01457 family)
MLPAFTTYLIDLDGVIYRGEELLPGADRFVQWLDATHKKYLFLTNNSFASDTQVIAKLARLGIQTDSSHVLGAGQAAVQYIARRFPGGMIYVVGEQPLKEMALARQLQLADSSTPPTAINAVLVGLDRNFNFQTLTEAVRAVRAGAAFIAINRDPLLPLEGHFIPGCGAMVAAIEASGGVTPLVIGKPQPTLLQEAMNLLGSTPDETVMIGDGLDSDIAGGVAADTHTIFVLSGRDTRSDLAKARAQPDYIYDDIAAVLADLQTSEKTIKRQVND